MTNQHPITPPPELVWEWTSLANEEDGDEVWISITTQAAQWGADQELEACVEWLNKRFQQDPFFSKELCAARRTKPPTLKEQALKALDHICVNHSKATDHECTIRRALEALPND